MLRFTVSIDKAVLLAELQGLVLDASETSVTAKLLPAPPDAPDYQVEVVRPRLVWLALLQEQRAKEAEGVTPLLALAERETIDLSTGKTITPEDAP